jgi:hypothetical protein
VVVGDSNPDPHFASPAASLELGGLGAELPAARSFGGSLIRCPALAEQHAPVPQAGTTAFFKEARDQAFFHTFKGTGLTGAHCLTLEAMMENSRNATEKTSRSREVDSASVG